MILAGATLERPPGRKYVDALRFAELTFPSSLPKRGTLARWRATLPPEMEVALVAPRATRISTLGAFRFDEALEKSLAWYVSALEATDAHAVIPTGAELSTSTRDRERFATWLAKLPRREGRHLVWAPSGIWEAELAQPFAAELGVICAFDPLQDDVPEGPVGYARLQALGGRQRFGEGLLSEVLDALDEGDLDKTYVAIESARSFQEAKMLQALAGGTDFEESDDEEEEEEEEEDEDLDDEDLEDED
ncbi:MAG: hypothetical protein H6724_15385 [Sandaracinus sp.]|nr:hypothetical protein [Sandaracinus sp.]